MLSIIYQKVPVVARRSRQVAILKISGRVAVRNMSDWPEPDARQGSYTSPRLGTESTSDSEVSSRPSGPTSVPQRNYWK